MPRAIRVQYPGAWYHVMARGNRRGAIFLDDEDRENFLKALGEVCEMTGWEVHAWVLMSNHYHMVIRTPEPNLVDGMKWLQNTFTRRFNCLHREWCVPALIVTALTDLLANWLYRGPCPPCGVLHAVTRVTLPAGR